MDKWSGSIEIGVTTHNPNNLDYPATMTNLRSGNIHTQTALIKTVVVHCEMTDIILAAYIRYNHDEWLWDPDQWERHPQGVL